jgi:GNAT superfamily N-acetyltransferase
MAFGHFHTKIHYNQNATDKGVIHIQGPSMFEVICPSEFSHYATLRAYDAGEYVGVAKLSRNGDSAGLLDIVIEDRVVRSISWLPYFNRRICHRNKGYGTQLLACVIDFCAKHDVKRVYGKAVGNMEVLIPWYKKHGFSIDKDNHIEKVLNG